MKMVKMLTMRYWKWLRACRIERAAREEQMWLRSVRVRLQDGSTHSLDDLQGMKDRTVLLENQMRLLGTELAESRGRVVQLEAELRESPMKAMVREIVREAMDRELQPGGKLWVSPCPIQYPHKREGGYQGGRT